MSAGFGGQLSVTMQQSGFCNVHSECDKSRSRGLVCVSSLHYQSYPAAEPLWFNCEIASEATSTTLNCSKFSFFCANQCNQSINMRLINIPISCFRSTTAWMLSGSAPSMEEGPASTLKPPKPAVTVLRIPLSWLQSRSDQHPQERHLLSRPYLADINLVHSKSTQ